MTAEELRRLTGYAVAPRYPYFPVEEAERELPHLLGIAQRVLAAAESSTRA